ncbi:hypothetical protein N7539_005004 [Penicillium diatomitis]|uniref:Uncharacterized protein n=1 Tax=Penicillium diatomitis TaxID=2819901 RepID=A0A9W9X6K4_9EURO|nr:uncharacterized protein N7539_005004 [Penicillium diatomitis]KAJ5485016.1 hypothetical protein N7539_005004 [Penicillium diatomitis]
MPSEVLKRRVVDAATAAGTKKMALGPKGDADWPERVPLQSQKARPLSRKTPQLHYFDDTLGYGLLTALLLL